ncbi:hypothetical protein BC628DRAFT_768095 [Trametes gibbosa]|nr:hypothetical protein BC628DRAFT_768095 [Trametes gibbosa]
MRTPNPGASLSGRIRPSVILPLMSSASSPSVELGKGVLLNNYMAAASIAILYFDYFLTVIPEIDRFWGKARLSAASFLFVLNRYVGLLGIIPVMMEYFGHFPPHRCRQLQTYHQYYSIAMQVIVASILLLRTLALYDRSKRILWVLVVVCFSAGMLTVLVISKVINFTATIEAVAQTPRGDYMGYCDLSLTVNQGYRSVVGWIAMLCVETTIFSLTLFKAIHMRTSLRHGTIGVLFRDGALYYGVLVLAGVANISTFLAPGINDNDRGIATTLANVLSTTLTSRMFLNLRDPSLYRSRLRVGRWSVTHHLAQPGAGALALQTVSTSRDDARTLSFRGSDDEAETDSELEEDAGTGADSRRGCAY